MKRNSWKGISLAVFALFNSITPAITEAEQRLYWADSNFSAPAIRCVDSSLNSCTDKVAPSNTALLNLTMGDYIGGIALDEKNQKVIFTNSGNPGSIQKVNMDGSGAVETLVTNAGNTPTHIAVDPLTQKMYWTSFDGIYSGDTTTDAKTLLSVTAAISFQGIAVDATTNKLVWIEGFSGSIKTIYSADLTTLTPVAQTTFPTDDAYGIVIADALSPLSRIFWVAYQSSTSASINYYEGYTPAQAVNTLLSNLSGPNYYSYSNVLIDFPETNIYFANRIDRKIYKSSLIPAQAAQNVYLTGTGDVTGMVFDCGMLAPDTDADKTPNCRDLCPSDPNKTTSSGACGCGVAETDTDADGTPDCVDTCDGTIDTDGDGTADCSESCDSNPLKTEPDTCPCETLEDISTDGKAICVKNRQLAPNTKIEEPPLVTVDEDEVTIVFEKFVKPTLTLKKKKNKKGKDPVAASFYEYSFEIKATGLKVSYEIQLSKTDAAKRDIKKLQSKRNELTLKNLAPGNYNVKYKAVIMQNGKPVARTGFSPDAQFTVG